MKNNNPSDSFNFINYNSPRRNPGYIYTRYQEIPQWPSTQRSHPPNRSGSLPNSKSCGQNDGHRHIISRTEEISILNAYIKYGIEHCTYDNCNQQKKTLYPGNE
ncbi:hypothetical protein EDEG_04185 [Edhazardia aedis USNM 41457]|uniref:Uncharacterized protein n=1 Tax=Edhazardia aedis (strain USNM 41457) TaxID=1003232 RepID=J9DBI3_EDHAE|nr:hypothetical protein EDEG_04185 [Edhazardia aedis USNM 41457]|eukprot:EJW04854.1 hypothetical protein EDEG_04185 [Edhazardia aedis USNM 41457]